MEIPDIFAVARDLGLEEPIQRHNRFYTRCPNHDDRDPSLELRADGFHSCWPCRHHGGVIKLVKFILKCEKNEAKDWLIEKGHLKPGAAKRQITKRYPYKDLDGTLLYEVCRFEPGFGDRDKDFMPCRTVDGQTLWSLTAGWHEQNRQGQWWRMRLKRHDPNDRPEPKDPPAEVRWFDGIEKRVLYRLPELKRAIELHRPIFILEGEKDVDNLLGTGWPVGATTCNGGANAWNKEENEHFAGARVHIIGDNDDAGRKYAEFVALQLHGVARSVKIVTIEMENFPAGGDISDWLYYGGTKEDLQVMCERAPLWRPAADQPPTQAEPLHVPAEIDLERVILAGCLVDPATLQEIEEYPFHEQEFYEPKHQRFFRALIELAREGKPFDPQLIVYKTGGQVPEEYIDALYADAPSGIETLLEYCRIVKQKACERRLLAHSTKLQGLLRTAKSDPDLILAETDRIVQLQAAYTEAMSGRPQILGRDVGVLMRTDLGPPPDMFWGEWLGRRTAVVVAADAKVGKSLFITNLMAALACGFPDFLGHPIKQCRVMYVEREVGEHYLKRRLLDMEKTDSRFSAEKIRTHALELADCYMTFGLTGNSYVANEHVYRDRAILERTIKYFRPDVLIIDPLYMYFPGDENASETFVRMFEYLDSLKERFNLGVILNHHVRKAGAQRRYSESVMERIRGHSVIKGWFHAIIGLLWPDATAEANKSHVRMEIVPRHGGRSIPNVILRRISDSCPWFTIDEEYKEGRKVQLKVSDERVVEILQEIGPHLETPFAQAIADRLDVAKNTGKAAIERAVKAGLVEKRDDGRYHVVET